MTLTEWQSISSWISQIWSFDIANLLVSFWHIFHLSSLHWYVPGFLMFLKFDMNLKDADSLYNFFRCFRDSMRSVSLHIDFSLKEYQGFGIKVVFLIEKILWCIFDNKMFLFKSLSHLFFKASLQFHAVNIIKKLFYGIDKICDITTHNDI